MKDEQKELQFYQDGLKDLKDYDKKVSEENKMKNNKTKQLYNLIKKIKILDDEYYKEIDFDKAQKLAKKIIKLEIEKDKLRQLFDIKTIEKMLKNIYWGKN